VTTSRVLDGAAILANARRIAPELRERAREVEAARRLTKPVVDALRDSGVFRMSMPRERGGPGVDLVRQVEILEVLARADASAAWCAMIGSDSGFFSGFLDDTDAHELYPGLDGATAGFVQPSGRLEIAPGGYRLSGRWSFGSGITHADVVTAGAYVTEHGVPRLGPDGRPEWRVGLLPTSQVRVHDTWDTTGLRGTGSHDYSVDDVLVPAGHTFMLTEPKRDGALYRWPAAFTANLLAVPLGVAADALDTAMGILDRKVVMPEGGLARDDARVRDAVARAQAMVGSARSYTFDTLGACSAALESGEVPNCAARAALAGCRTHTVTACRDAVGLLVDTVGTSAVRRGSTLERNMRDLITLGQHFTVRPKMREWAGGLWFGQPAPSPLL
jgi:alkylation response protein AidB-like acyl-CoA dehydrogenase